ncbi:hypothetical protein GKC30_02965 [Pseudodesulfovibrio sp. F-1]|uniref:Lipoprotein n=1 Tax=Pseudodesulfovibrio alkaliphilus TaxID=2661613 RepID=A0A7K1KL19_9BACT|nr:LPS assembly lipoprotein LptE [Pseudodesulfovibrio alkaliphilus]MUM76592.1 hypothetical protein [Pseudodesulfovibrio alkaliphilus]
MPLVRTLIPLLLPAALFLLTACGYSVGGAGERSVLGPEFRTLAISGVENPTTLPWLESRVRSLLRDELTRRGAITWTDSRNQADALIHITIHKYFRPTAVEGSREQTLRSSAIFLFSAEVISNTDSSVVWRSGEILQEWPFYPGQEDEADAEVTNLGIRRLADKMEQNY